MHLIFINQYLVEILPKRINRKIYSFKPSTYIIFACYKVLDPDILNEMQIKELNHADLLLMAALQPKGWPDIIPHIKFYINASLFPD